MNDTGLRGTCTIGAPAWYCSLDLNHDGPCPLWPEPELLSYRITLAGCDESTIVDVRMSVEVAKDVAWLIDQIDEARGPDAASCYPKMTMEER